MRSNGPREEDARALFPRYACSKRRVEDLLPQVGKSGEVVVEQQVVRVTHASQSDEKHAGFGARKLTQSNNRLGESHTLCLPRCQGPRQTKRKLYAAHVVAAIGTSHGRQDGNPRRAFRFCEEARPFVLREVDHNESRQTTNDVVVVGVVAVVENNLDDLTLASVDQTVLDGQVVEQQHRGAHSEFQARSEAAKVCVVRRQTVFVRDPFVHGVEGYHGHLRFLGEGSYAGVIVHVAVFFFASGGTPAELHEHGRVCEEHAVRGRATALLQLAQPEVVLRGERHVAQSQHDLAETDATLVGGQHLRVWLGTVEGLTLQAVHCGEHHDLRELLVNGQAAVGERHLRPRSLRTCFLVRLAVVHLLIRDRFALRGVADAHAGDAAESLARCVPRTLRLTEPAVYAAHKLASDHADLVQEEQERFSESLLQRVQLVSIEPSERLAQVTMVDQTVYRSRVEAQVESRRTCGCGNLDEACVHATSCKQAAEFLQSSLHGVRLACASGAEQQQAQGLDSFQ